MKRNDKENKMSQEKKIIQANQNFSLRNEYCLIIGNWHRRRRLLKTLRIQDCRCISSLQKKRYFFIIIEKFKIRRKEDACCYKEFKITIFIREKMKQVIDLMQEQLAYNLEYENQHLKALQTKKEQKCVEL